jgi:hypothetical protein
VRLKITKVNCKLSLPIHIYLANAPSRRSVEHEYGHVRICQNVYAHADQVARQCATKLVGNEYEGSGRSHRAAAGAAVQKAIDELESSYRTATSDRVNRLSRIYDGIDATRQLPINTELRMAEAEVKSSDENKGTAGEKKSLGKQH